jgi:hypothetical protein
MIGRQLSIFIDRVVEAKSIAKEDITYLTQTVLEDGLATRREAEALLVLDRTVPAEAGFADLVVALVVDFVVFGTRPTGTVTREDAAWLAAVLETGRPNATALRIAEEVVAVADGADESLVSFILKGRRVMRTLAA